eukprot:IDg1353t1
MNVPNTTAKGGEPLAVGTILGHRRAAGCGNHVWERRSEDEVLCGFSFMDTDSIRKICQQRVTCARCVHCGIHCECSPRRAWSRAASPLGWTTGDLSFLVGDKSAASVTTDPVLSYVETVLTLEEEGVLRCIRSTSDLLAADWYTEKDRSWSVVARRARNVLWRFYEMGLPCVVLRYGHDRTRPGGRGDVPELKRAGGPQGIEMDHYVPAGGFGEEVIDMTVSGPSIMKVSPFWAEGHTDKHAGVMVKVTQVGASCRPVYACVRDIRNHPGWNVVVDHDVLDAYANSGSKYHVVGVCRGAYIVTGAPQLGPRYSIIELPSEAELARKRRVYIPPAVTVGEVLRGTAKSAKILGSGCVALGKLAKLLGKHVNIVVSAFQMPEYADVVRSDSGCYTRLLSGGTRPRRELIGLRGRRAGGL